MLPYSGYTIFILGDGNKAPHILFKIFIHAMSENVGDYFYMSSPNTYYRARIVSEIYKPCKHACLQGFLIFDLLYF